MLQAAMPTISQLVRSLENVRLDDWYFLVFIQLPTLVKGVHFTDISSLRLPSLVPSELKGDVTDVTLYNVTLAGTSVKTKGELPSKYSDDVPADGGYVFVVVANHGSSIAIDGKYSAQALHLSLRFVTWPVMRQRQSPWPRS